MNLKPNETDLVGRSIRDGENICGDDVANRIKYLTENILTKIAISKDYGEWETLYQDPSDGRLWERTYPQGELQGGGPPRLRTLTLDEARRKYGVP